ncbi:MAG: hypothetical protein ACKPJD_34740, partial [Planctomycetaceae bacterium]
MPFILSATFAGHCRALFWRSRSWVEAVVKDLESASFFNFAASTQRAFGASAFVFASLKDPFTAVSRAEIASPSDPLARNQPVNVKISAKPKQ